MSQEGNLDKMPDDELEGVSGGYGKIEYGSDGDFSFSYECTRCKYTEFITTGNARIYMTVDGEFKCPKCGYTNDYHLKVDRFGISSWGRP